jgi:phosphatidylcholine synthase
MARPFIDRVLRLPLQRNKGSRVKNDHREERERRRQEREYHKAARRAAPVRTTPTVRFLAWCVHFYTALGLVCAAGIAVALVDGGPGGFRWSFGLMALATFIDATDGTLARGIRIKEVLPNFDGRKLDDITDFLTYTVLPLVLIWRAALLPAGTEWALVLPLLASAYGFCQCAAKTDDGYFLGFPSLWNVVAFYLYVLQVPPWLALAAVVILALMTFVPSKYLYPTQPGRFNMLANVLAAVWIVVLGPVLWALPTLDALRAGTASAAVVGLAWVSLFYPLFYMTASWVITLKGWKRRPVAEAVEPAV